MSFLPEFETVEIDGKKKKICPKCNEPKDPRGIKLHYVGCTGDKAPGEEEDQAGNNEEVESMANDKDKEEIKKGIMDEVNKKFEDLGNSFSEKINKGFEDIKESIGSYEDEEDLEEDEDEEDQEDDKKKSKSKKKNSSDSGEGGLFEELEPEDWAMIGLGITIIFIVLLIFFGYSYKESKTTNGEKKKSESKKEESKSE